MSFAHAVQSVPVERRAGCLVLAYIAQQALESRRIGATNTSICFSRLRRCVCQSSLAWVAPSRSTPDTTLRLEPSRFGHFSLALRISSFGNSSPLPCSRGTLARAHERPRTHRTLGVGDASPIDGRGTLLHRRPHALRRAAGPDGQLQRRPGRADNYEPMLFSSRRLPESFSCDIVKTSSQRRSLKA